MKKILTILTLVAMIMVAGCVDLDDILRRLDEQERELATMKSLVDAMDKKISVQSFKELADKSGYELTMSDGSKIVLKHGAKGEKGEQGNPGQHGDANLTITEESGVVTIVYKGITYTLPKYVLKMTFTTAKSVGQKIGLLIDAAEADRANVWIDLNNNGVKDAGEEVTEFYSDIEYTLGSQTVTIYGKVTRLFCKENQLTSLDVSKNTALEWLDCFDNPLASLDVSNNTELNILTCCYNQLTSLDVSNNIALSSLDCGFNQLTSLDVSNNANLWSLSCSENKLTSLNVSNNTKLASLLCYRNQLTALEVSNNTKLEYLWCDDNKISGGNMTALVNSLPNRTGKEAGKFRVIAVGSGDEQNVINATQAATAKSKNWSVQDGDGNPYTP